MEWIPRADLGRKNGKMKRNKPPKFAERILSILSFSRKIGILGDAEEEYSMILAEKGLFLADKKATRSKLILSGILDKYEEKVQKKFSDMKCVERICDGEWISLVMEK